MTLDLWFGDINELTGELDDSLNQQVDARFLDGFAPAKNPDMWTQDLFSAMARGATRRDAGHLYLRRFCPPWPAGGRLYHA